jgi:hypothetical protein
MHFMLQREVVDRMVAEPGSKDFGRLSVMLQYHFHMERLFIVPPGSFNPPPKVDSAIVRMIPIDHLKVGAGETVKNHDRFASVVASAFSQRRKMLRNTLRELIAEADLAALGITPTARAEDIAVADYVRLANFLAGAVATESKAARRRCRRRPGRPDGGGSSEPVRRGRRSLRRHALGGTQIPARRARRPQPDPRRGTEDISDPLWRTPGRDRPLAGRVRAGATACMGE